MVRNVCAVLLMALSLGCVHRMDLNAWTAVRGKADVSSLRQTGSGSVLGFADSSSTQAWVGVPYAAPPVGDLRWRAPRPPMRWQTASTDAPRLATRYGEQCPQFGRASGKGDRDVVGSEDCLTLSIYAPRFTPDQIPSGPDRRPVMVWIHGGGNVLGTANSYGLARNLAARYGVIVVAPNYRLGVLGWLHHPALEGSGDDRSGDYGTLDLIAALKWVHDNIGAFGGDPQNVTVFGESAGAFNTFSLLASPMARGLFQRAIAESGIPSSYTIAQAEHFVDDPEPGQRGSSGELLIALLLSDHMAKDRADAKRQLAVMPAEQVAAYLRQKTPAQLLAPLAGAPFGMYPWPAVIRDGRVIPLSTVTEAIAATPAADRVPVLLGSNRDEFKLFMANDPKYVSRWLWVLPHIKDVGKYNRESAVVSDAWRAVGVDAPAQALEADRSKGVFAYRFDWDEEPKHWLVDLRTLLGAAHGLEVGFVFDDETGAMDPFGVHSKDNAAGCAALARTMSSYWAEFARTGRPGRGADGTLPQWEDYGDGAFMRFDSPEGGGVSMQHGRHTLDEAEARIWTMDGETHAQRCRAEVLMMQQFLGPAGAWTPERARRYQERCPELPAASVAPLFGKR